jgi:hypothetical protein
MAQALEAVRAGELRYRKAAQAAGVNLDTLQRALKESVLWD